MTAAARFGRVITAMITPFTESGDLDLDGAATLARWLVEHGSDGLVLAGTTGEGPTLSDPEKIELFSAVRAAVDVPLLAGTGSNDTRHTAELCQKAAATGVDGLLIQTPYYNRPTPAGIEAHFRAVAAATDLPVVCYDVPGRTARPLGTGVIIRLANEVPSIVGLKDAAGDPGATARVVAATPEDFEVWSGDDSLTLPLLAVGAVGVIGVATHWSGPQHAEMVAAALRGDLEAARAVNATLLDSYDLEVGPTWVQTTAAKAALGVLGLPAGPCRLPLAPVPDELRERARHVLTALGVTR
jgi:4-hydroxy-tetrahydrodipicolinate synthase